MKTHQQEFEQYLEDWKTHNEPWKLWQVQSFSQLDLDWTCWQSMHYGDIVYFGNINYNFRRKPDNIDLNKIYLSKPITEQPNSGTDIYIFTGEKYEGFYKGYFNTQNPRIDAALKNGCIHSSKENVLKWVDAWRELVINKL